LGGEKKRPVSRLEPTERRLEEVGPGRHPLAGRVCGLAAATACSCVFEDDVVEVWRPET
jgi:hypothetical protein